MKDTGINLYDIVRDDKDMCKLVVSKRFDIGTTPMIDDVISLLSFEERLRILFYERSYIIALDDYMNPKGILLMSSGSQTQTENYYDILSTFLLLIGAKSYVHVHNHPNNILEFSDQDKICFQALAQSQILFNITNYENVVITRDGFLADKTGTIYYFDEEDLEAEI